MKLRAAETAKSFLIDMWLARQTPDKVLPILHKVVEGAKEEFADAVANGEGIYAVGYCFGGKYVAMLASDLPDTVAWGQAVKDEEQGVVKTGPLIKAGAFAHGAHSLFNICYQPLRLHRYPNYERGCGGDPSARFDGLRRYVQNPALYALLRHVIDA